MFASMESRCKVLRSCHSAGAGTAGLHGLQRGLRPHTVVGEGSRGGRIQQPPTLLSNCAIAFRCFAATVDVVRVPCIQGFWVACAHRDPYNTPTACTGSTTRYSHCAQLQSEQKVLALEAALARIDAEEAAELDALLACRCTADVL